MAILKIPVTKAGNRVIEVDVSKFSDEVYEHAMIHGLKPLVNANMTKILTKDLEGDDLADAQAAAFAKAEENLAKLYDGNVKRSRGGVKTADGKKVPGVVMTEARRLAKEVVKNEIRASGKKISHVEPSLITKIANEMIAADPQFIADATANIEARAKIAPKIDLSGLLVESPKLLAAAEARKAESKKTLSAKQAGKVAPRKPKPETHVSH
jgi:hypothetical protein